MCSADWVHRTTRQQTAHTRNKSEPHTFLLSRKYQTTHTPMANINTRHLDSPSNHRIFNPLRVRTPSSSVLSQLLHDPDRRISSRPRDNQADPEKGSGRDSTGASTLHKPDVCRSQKGRQMETSNKPKETKPVCLQGPFQDGGHQRREGYHPSRRFYGQIGLKGSILFCPHKLHMQEVSPIQMEKQAFAIHMPSIRSQQRSLRFYQTPPPSFDTSKRARYSLPNVSGRFADFGEDEGRAKMQLPEMLLTTDISGLHAERREIHPGTNSADRVPRVPNQHPKHDSLSNPGEVVVSMYPMQVDTEKEDHNYSKLSQDNRHYDLIQTSNSPSTSALQRTTGVKKRLSEPPPLIRCYGTSGSENEEGPGVVDKSITPLELQTNLTKTTLSDSGVRCIKPGMGSSQIEPQRFYKRSMEFPRTTPPHKCQGITSCMVCNSVLCINGKGHTYSFEDRQHDISGSCQQNGGDPLPNHLPNSTGNVGMVLATQHHHISGTSSRLPEPDSRHGIKSQSGLLRVVTEYDSFSEIDEEKGTMYSRPFRIPPFGETTNILQLESRPRSNCSGCPLPTMEQSAGICLPSLLPSRPLSCQDHGRESTTDDHRNTLMEITNMVSSPVGDADRDSNNPPRQTEYSHRPMGKQTPPDSTRSSTTNRLDRVRNTLKGSGLSERAIQIICSSWRHNTEASYSSSWRLWCNWCTTKNINPTDATIGEVIEFLSIQFDQGKQYSTLNSYRSSISATHMPIEGVPVGKHPLISRLMKGVFHLRPPKPRYKGRWNVSRVLQHIESKGDSTSLCMKDLTLKLVMLLALANADRVSDLCALDLQYLSLTKDSAVFRLVSLTKTARPDKHITSCYNSLPGSALCPVETLKRYISRTSSWRKDLKSGKLLLALNKPHHPVTSATVARWLKQVLKDAGVSESYTAHSVRATSVSVAFDKGVNLSEIMQTADWSSDSVFKKFYYKPLPQSVNNFTRAVLSD